MMSLHEEYMDMGVDVITFYFETHGNLYMNKQSYFHRELRYKKVL
jgi:hypothetical protein